MQGAASRQRCMRLHARCGTATHATAKLANQQRPMRTLKHHGQPPRAHAARACSRATHAPHAERMHTSAPALLPVWLAAASAAGGRRSCRYLLMPGVVYRNVRGFSRLGMHLRCCVLGQAHCACGTMRTDSCRRPSSGPPRTQLPAEQHAVSRPRDVHARGGRTPRAAGRCRGRVALAVRRCIRRADQPAPRQQRARHTTSTSQHPVHLARSGALGPAGLASAS